MSPGFAAAAILAFTFALVVVVDRGVPNTLEAIAFSLETGARHAVAALRRNAAALRARQRRIELANQERLARMGTHEPTQVVANSRSFSAAA